MSLKLPMNLMVRGSYSILAFGVGARVQMHADSGSRCIACELWFLCPLSDCMTRRPAVDAGTELLLEG